MKMTTLDMCSIRQLNLFERITGVRTKTCFSYNNAVIFAVPFAFVSKAIGREGKNVKKLVSIIGKKIKIVSLPRGIGDARKFISDIVAPNTFRNLEINDKEIIISASMQSKASLIGRNKARLQELEKIVREVFGAGLRVV